MANAFLNNLTDVAMTTNGDLTIGPDGDFQINVGASALLQSILFRLKTVRTDWQLRPDCGASLEQFFGATNTPQMGSEVQAEVEYALTHDNFLSLADLEIRVTPISTSQVAIVIRVQLDQDPLVLISGLDFKEGILQFPRI